MANKKTPKKHKYSTMHELLLLKLQVLHDVEKELIKALPKMAKAASNPDLRDAFLTHLEETKTHESRIDQALEIAGGDKRKQKSEAIRGLIKDAQWCIKNIMVPEARDASLIAAAQYVEHYEIAGYGSARTWAQEMGHAEIVNLLQETLDEEGNANKILTALAENGINENVASGMEKEIQ